MGMMRGTDGVVDTGFGNGPVLDVRDERVAPPATEQATEPDAGHRDIEPTVDGLGVTPDSALGVCFNIDESQ